MAIREIETRTLEDIRHFQEQELKKLLGYLKANSKYYSSSFRKHKIDIDKINTLDDLRHIPLTTKEDLQLHGSDFVCVDKSQIVDYITTSGTLGEPVIFAMTDNDLNRLAYNEFLGFRIAGCYNNDVFQLMTTIDRRFMAGLDYFLDSRIPKPDMNKV